MQQGDTGVEDPVHIREVDDTGPERRGQTRTDVADRVRECEIQVTDEAQVEAILLLDIGGAQRHLNVFLWSNPLGPGTGSSERLNSGVGQSVGYWDLTRPAIR
jgi:hypothetical protein